MRERAAAILVVGVAAVSCAAVLIRLCPAPALSIAAWRLVLSALGFHLAARFRRRPREAAGGLRGRDVPAAVAAGGFLALHFAAWISSLEYTSVAASVVLVTTHPIFVGLGSWLFLKEPVGRPLLLGTAVSMAGGVLVGWSGAAAPGSSPPLGNAPATVALFLLGEPVGATVLAWLVLGEVPAGLQVAGGVLVLAGVALALKKVGTPTKSSGQGNLLPWRSRFDLKK